MCGSLFGCTSIWTMTMIALDRYNVIVKVMIAAISHQGTSESTAEAHDHQYLYLY